MIILVAVSIVRFAFDNDNWRERDRSDATLPQILIDSHLLFTKLRNDLKAAYFKKFDDSVPKNNLVVFRIDNLHDLSKELAVLQFLII